MQSMDAGTTSFAEFDVHTSASMVPMVHSPVVLVPASHRGSIVCG